MNTDEIETIRALYLDYAAGLIEMDALPTPGQDFAQVLDYSAKVLAGPSSFSPNAANRKQMIGMLHDDLRRTGYANRWSESERAYVGQIVDALLGRIARD